MAKDQPKETKDTATDPNKRVEDALEPFQQASNKFLQAHLSAQAAAAQESARTWLDYQDGVRQIEQEAQNALSEAARKYLDQSGKQDFSSPDQLFAARAQAQAEFENEARRIYTDAQSKLASLNQKHSEGGEGGDKKLRKVADQRQNAYEAYQAELQKAWANTKTSDPQTINAIASHILLTINSVGHGG